MAIALRLSTNKVDGRVSLGGVVDTSSTGVYSPSTVTTNAVLDEITKNENIAGTTDYRCLYVKNESTTSDVYSLRLAFQSLPTTDTYQLGLLSGKNVVAEAIPDENTAPSGIVFKDAVKSEQITLISSGTDVLRPGEYVGFWLKRTPRSLSSSGQILSELALEITIAN